MWVDDTGGAAPDEAALVLLELGWVLDVPALVVWGILVGKTKAAVAVVASRPFLPDSIKRLADLVVEWLDFAGHVVHVTVAGSEDDLISALDNEGVLANNDRHALTIAGELVGADLRVLAHVVLADGAEALHRLLLHEGIVVSLLWDTDLLSKDLESSLGWLAVPLVLLGISLVHDGGIIAKGGDHSALLGSLVLWHVGNLGTTRLDEALWAIAVTLNIENADSTGVDSKECLDSHFVGGKSTGLIRADDRSATKGLDSWELGDDSLLLSHTVDTEGKGGCDDSRKTFWDGSDSERDGDLEERDSTEDPASLASFLELANVSNPGEDADVKNCLGDDLTEGVELLLEWGLGFLGLVNSLLDLTNFTLWANSENNTLETAAGKWGTTEAAVGLLKEHSASLDLFDALASTDGLTGEGALVGSKDGGLDLADSAIGWDWLTFANFDKITADNFSSINLLDLAVSDDVSKVWLECFEGFDTCLSVKLLNNRNHSVKNKNEDDDPRLDEGGGPLLWILLSESEDETKNDSEKKNLNHAILKVLSDHGPDGFLLWGWESVLAILLAVLFRALSGQTLLWVRPEEVHDLLRVFGKCVQHL